MNPLPSSAATRLVLSVATACFLFTAFSGNAAADVSQKEQAFAQFELAVRNVPLPNIDAIPKVVEFEGFISYSSPVQGDGEVTPIQANVIAAPVFSRELPKANTPDVSLRVGAQDVEKSIWYSGTSLRGQIFHPIDFSISSDAHPALMPEDDREETVIRFPVPSTRCTPSSSAEP